MLKCHEYICRISRTRSQMVESYTTKTGHLLPARGTMETYIIQLAVSLAFCSVITVSSDTMQLHSRKSVTRKMLTSRESILVR
jgi:hypothetical protein